MRFKEIEDEAIRDSALEQYAKQLKVSQSNRHLLVNCYVAMLDYSNTKEGYDYWNEVRNLKDLKEYDFKKHAKQVYHRYEKKYLIGKQFTNLLKQKNISISELSDMAAYTEYILDRVAKNRYVDILFIKDICEYLDADPKELTKGAETKIPKERQAKEPNFPKGTKRVCTNCKENKDLETEYNNFIYGQLGKAAMCRKCVRKKYKKKD